MTKKTRPQPISAEKRKAIFARYEVKGYKSMMMSDGPAFTCTLYRDGKKFLLVEQGGHGAPNEYHSAQRGKKYDADRARADYDTFHADAVAWYVGSDDEAEFAKMCEKSVEELGYPYDPEDFFTDRLIRVVEDRKHLMSRTSGGKRVLFQIGDKIGGTEWMEYHRYFGRAHTTGSAKRARILEIVDLVKQEAKGQPLRIVYRAGDNQKELMDITDNRAKRPEVTCDA